jgi:hypothetical protein
MNGPACARLDCGTPHLGDANDIPVFEFNPPLALGAGISNVLVVYNT